MSIFADTSGLYALLFESEESHADVVRVFRGILAGGRPLWTTSYVLVETTALLQSRVGLEPVRAFDEHVLPMLSVEWVSEALHRRGTQPLLAKELVEIDESSPERLVFLTPKGREHLAARRDVRQTSF